MSTEQVNIATPANLIIFNDTNIGSSLDTIKSFSIKLYYATVDNSLNTSPVYLKIYGTTAPGSVIVGTTPSDICLFVPGSTVLQVNFMLDAATPGTTFNQCSAACVTQPGTSGTTAPANPINFTLAYV